MDFIQNNFGICRSIEVYKAGKTLVSIHRILAITAHKHTHTAYTHAHIIVIIFKTLFISTCLLSKYISENLSIYCSVSSSNFVPSYVINTCQHFQANMLISIDCTTMWKCQWTILQTKLLLHMTITYFVGFANC